MTALRIWLIRLLGGVPNHAHQRCQGSQMTRRWCEYLTREEIVDCLAEECMTDKTWFRDYVVLERVSRRLQGLLNAKYPGRGEVGHMEHFHSLEQKNGALKQEIRTLQEVAEHRNKQMAAVKYIVSCTGCEAGGPANKEEITEAEVQDVEQIAKRLRTWWQNHNYRLEHATQ